MEDIHLDRHGRILAGENEGFFIHVHFDAERTHGYYVFMVDDIENPSDGGDHWAADMAELRTLFRTSDWRIEWL
ncbi:hypothetical protein [Catellatospora sichuanensis]|uniref:hypothetical protein n=1 Tax=Catellatospora sichuanensis TaxID=1969805 RepID=UPI0011822115|nr:hypothetical protein [Catellatospora sichuanensis]